MVASVNLFRSKWLGRFHLISLLHIEVSFYWFQSQGSLPLVYPEETEAIVVNFVPTNAAAGAEIGIARNTDLGRLCPSCERHLAAIIFRVRWMCEMNSFFYILKIDFEWKREPLSFSWRHFQVTVWEREKSGTPIMWVSFCHLLKKAWRWWSLLTIGIFQIW